MIRALRAWFVALIYGAPPPAVPEVAITPHPDTEETRAAVHEAGHALVAWRCTAVVEVLRVSVAHLDDPTDRRAGVVAYRSRRGTREERWCALVVHLAGVAAEGLVFGSFSAKEAESDLTRARAVAEELAAGPAPAWVEAAAGPTPPFARVYASPPPPEVAEALTRGYRVAQAVLAAHARAHVALTSALLHRRELSAVDVSRVLGHRVGVELVGAFAAKFM